ncbi:hypothetical protein L1887_50645 [Cichorium endivia]|nr:hypothetical protein L1887_50645 [Cichorium endivia]
MSESWIRIDHRLTNTNSQIDTTRLQRKDEGEDVVGQRLRIAVERVEGVAGKRRGHEPLVVRLVHVLVQPRVVLDPVHPVDQEVGEHKEERHRKHRVRPAVVRNAVIQLAVPSHLEDEPGDGQKVERQKRAHRRLDLELDLVLEEARVRTSSDTVWRTTLSRGSAETLWSADQLTASPPSADATAFLSTVFSNQLEGDNAEVLADAAHDAASLRPSRCEKLDADDADASEASAAGSLAKARGERGQGGGPHLVERIGVCKFEHEIHDGKCLRRGGG